MHPTLVRPSQLRGPYGAKVRHGLEPIRTADLTTRQEWEGEKLNVILDRLSEGTRRSYGQGWRWWALFCRRREVDPLRRVTSENRAKEEELVLDFVVHLAKQEKKTPAPFGSTWERCATPTWRWALKSPSAP